MALSQAKKSPNDPVAAEIRNFYKVELWTRDDQIERMLFAGTSLDQARAVFAGYARRHPAALLARVRVLTQWPKIDAPPDF